MTAIEASQASFEAKVTVLQHDTSYIKSMMSEINRDFKVHAAPSASVSTATLAPTMAPITVEGGESH